MARRHRRNFDVTLSPENRLALRNPLATCTVVIASGIAPRTTSAKPAPRSAAISTSTTAAIETRPAPPLVHANCRRNSPPQFLIGRPDRVAEAAYVAAFLAPDFASYISGEIARINAAIR